jgi:hypothetical protein
MKPSVKMALATTLLAAAGGLFLVGTSYAEPAFGHSGPFGGRMGPIGHEMLRGIDTNDDGALSQDEINAAVNGSLSEFDTNNDQALSLDEFQALWADLTRPLAVRAFQFLDPDGNASVSKAELDERFGTAVAHLDTNEDGMLSPEDRREHHRGGRRWRGWWGHGSGDEERPQE